MKHTLAFAALVFAGFAAQGAAAIMRTRRFSCRKDRMIRNRLSEHQIDNMIMDSFPASDPPSTY